MVLSCRFYNSILALVNSWVYLSVSINVKFEEIQGLLLAFAPSAIYYARGIWEPVSSTQT